MTNPEMVKKFLYDWNAMEKAAQSQTQYCESHAYGPAFPTTRQELLGLLERVYRTGFCAGANAIVAYDDQLSPGGN